MEVKKIINGHMDNNTFLVVVENECLMIDPSFDKQKIQSQIQSLTLKGILITHGHFDHIHSAAFFAQKYKIPIYINGNDQFLLKDPYGGVNNLFPKDDIAANFKYIDLTKNPQIDPKFGIEIILTPGHTPGSTCFYIKNLKAVFTGDTLFYNTIGNTRFPRSSEVELIKSIKEKILILPGDTTVYPGHGLNTTIENEKNNNPFL